MERKIYAVFEGDRIIKMGDDEKEMINYIKSFPREERSKMSLYFKIVRGEKEYEQSHWTQMEVRDVSERGR